MGRPLRIILPNLHFHVLNRGNNRQEVFKGEEDYIHYISLLKRYKEEFGFNLYHFCLMPNHAHFLMEPTTEGRKNGVKSIFRKNSNPPSLLRATEGRGN